MKTVFVNRYFYPDHSATSQILSDLAFELASRGRDIHVVASRQIYDNASSRLSPSEVMGGVSIHRVWSTKFGRSNLIGRAFDYLTFYVGAFCCLVSILRRGDVVVAKTDPPMISVVAAAAATIRGARWVNWLQDLFPEVAARLGVGLAKGIPGAIVSRVRNRSLRGAMANVAIGERMASELAAIGAPRRHVIHNWAVGESQVDSTANLRREWEIGDPFIVAYSGNLGRAHEFATIVGAIEKLRDEPGLLFVFIGGGNQTGALRSEIERRGLLSRVRFLPYQPLERLARSLATADVHLVSLQPSLEGLIVPSKFYGIVAARRPTIFVGDADGEIARLINRHECGLVVPVGDSNALAEGVRSLKADPRRRELLGENARQAHMRHFHRSVAIQRWIDVLEGPA